MKKINRPVVLHVAMELLKTAPATAFGVIFKKAADTVELFEKLCDDYDATVPPEPRPAPLPASSSPLGVAKILTRDEKAEQYRGKK